MAKNHAAKRAEKAARRKAVVAVKRKQGLAENSTAGRLRLAAGMPVLECLVSEGLFETGMGSIVLVRGARMGQAFLAALMLDTLALGVKDVNLESGDFDEIKGSLGMYQAIDPMEPMAPAEARKLLHDVVAWSDSYGFPPHADFAQAERLFGDVALAETDYRPHFGRDGKPVYLPGPTESAAQIRQRMAIVEANSGVEGRQATLAAIADVLESGLDEDDLAELAEIDAELDDDDIAELEVIAEALVESLDENELAELAEAVAELEGLDDDELADLVAIDGDLAVDNPADERDPDRPN